MAYDLIAKLRLIDNLSAPMAKATASIKAADNASKTMSSNLTKMGDVGRKSFDSMTVSAGALIKAYALIKTSQAAIKFAGDSMGKALDYEAQMSSIKALTGATNDEMKQMSDLALNMGSKTKYSALEAAKGIEELLKAGLTPAAVQGGALEAALNLATAGGLGLEEAAVTMSTALNAFKKDGMKAADASNILAGAANASATGVHELGYALASVGGVADMVGLSFKEVNAAIGIMANDGLKNGSDAGTSFKSMLMYLQPQTDKAAGLFDKLGLGVGKANKFFKDGKIRELPAIADQLQKTFKKFSEQDRTAIFLDMFGTDGVKAATSLFKAGADGVKKFYDEMGNVTAYQVATERMNNGRGAIEQFKGALETLQIRALTPLLPAVKYAFTGMGDIINAKTPQIVAAIQQMSDTAKSYIKTHFINNPEFNKLPDMQSQIRFVFDDLMKTFNDWYASSGSAAVDGLTSSLVSSMANALKVAAGPIASAGAEIGASLGKGMADGLQKTLADNPLLAMAVGGITGSRFGLPGAVAGVVVGAGAAGYSQYKEVKAGRGGGSGNAQTQSIVDAAKAYYDDLAKGPYGVGNEDPVESRYRGSHAGGLSRVPYNGYPTYLHKDETVLTKAEADARREGTNAAPVMVTGNTFIVRQESDIDAIAGALANKLNGVGTVVFSG